MSSSMKIEVAYASKDKQFLVEITLESSANVADAIKASGVLEVFPDLEMESISAGIFSRPTTMQTALSEGDRVEIYRPLEVDPKEARRLRAEVKGRKKSKKKSKSA